MRSSQITVKDRESLSAREFKEEKKKLSLFCEIQFSMIKFQHYIHALNLFVLTIICVLDLLKSNENLSTI